MLGDRTTDEWIRQYSASHQHPLNRACHMVGIPMIAMAIALIPFAAWQPRWRGLTMGLFILGWVFQFVGHAFERKPPEFFRDWRFLLVGLRWWFAKLKGQR